MSDPDDPRAGTINWVMQSAYKRPQFTMGVRRPGDFGLGAAPASDALHAALRGARRFSLAFLGDDQADVARAFMKTPQIDGSRINGAPFHTLCLCTVINAANTRERPRLVDRDATARPRGWLANLAGP